MSLSRVAWLVAVLGIAMAGPAAAVCSVDAAPVDFGVVDPQRQSRGTGEIVARCDATTAFTVGISPGGGGSGGRRMRGSPGGRLDYYLFADPGYSVPWGDGAAIGDPVAAVTDGANPKRLTIYGIVPAQNGIDAGEYDDSLQVTLTF